jgi:hypothetical protein
LHSIHLLTGPYIKGNIGEAIKSMTHLKQLHLFFLPEIHGRLSSLCHLEHHLEVIDIEECRNVSCDLSFISSLSKLKTLRLQDGDRIEGDLSSLSKLLSLSMLDLSGCSSVVGDVSILTSLSSLQCLLLIGCDNVWGNIDTLDWSAKLLRLRYVNIQQTTLIQCSAAFSNEWSGVEFHGE